MMRNTFIKIMAALLLVLLVPGIKAIHASAESDETTEVLVKYVSDVRSLTDMTTLQGIGTTETIAPQVELVTLSADVDREAIITQLENDPSVDYVEPNYERHLLFTVNDPGYGEQWWVPHVKAESMWKYAEYQQEKVVVAVIDSGVDVNHVDLKNRIEPGGYDFYANSSIITDWHGHGTKVAGVIAAQAGNGQGIAGIAGPYDVSMLPIKIVNSSGKSNTAILIKALEYAIAEQVDVINLSLGGDSFSAIENEVIQRAIDAGIVVVAAAGNDAKKGNPIIYPASYDNVISVGAVDDTNNWSVFSNFNVFVTLVAPGERVLTTFPNQSYGNDAGTSFSTPIVSGTVAMMKALEPGLSNREIEGLLTMTAQDLGEPGYDPFYGAGLLDIEQLTDELMRLTFKGDFPELTVSATKEFTVTFNQELVPGKDYRPDIIISRKLDGSGRVTSFTTTVDPTNPRKLLIAPTTNWDYGEFYLTITTEMQSKHNKALQNNIRMKYVVE